MPPHGRLLIAEQVLVPTQLQPIAALLDMQMLVSTEGGRERMAEEFESLLRASGFELRRIIPTTSIISLLEAVKR